MAAPRRPRRTCPRPGPAAGQGRWPGPLARAAGWKTEESARGAFTFQTPVNRTVQREPNPSGDTTTVTDPASVITISISAGLNGLGGACAPGQTGLDESMTVQQEPVPGMHLASTPIGGRTPTLGVEPDGIYFCYSANMTGAAPECGMHADLFDWPGVGTVRIGAKVSAMDLMRSGIEPPDYLDSELHRDLSRVLLSFAAVG
ncbi:hypothetical protein [Arthrobacter sp. H35-D1]|uniref:hypothetical protein n=1 Tax=Arthrobacter sp. H35-D1 TaxID=3046202 RepID=UPI0024BAF99D|nr:hypothetical protein [Arthrobacter sp. H35-D1]MDJ0315349.1 hypothetical protein [Arthrobacter sp. H35-D1]